MTPISQIASTLGTSMVDAAAATKPDAASGFGDVLKTKMGQLNESQAVGEKAAQDLATGRVDDVAGAMLSVERANIALELTTAIRNKAIEAYQEILRMQM